VGFQHAHSLSERPVPIIGKVLTQPPLSRGHWSPVSTRSTVLAFCGLWTSALAKFSSSPCNDSSPSIFHSQIDGQDPFRDFALREPQLSTHSLPPGVLHLDFMIHWHMSPTDRWLWLTSALWALGFWTPAHSFSVGFLSAKFVYIMPLVPLDDGWSLTYSGLWWTIAPVCTQRIKARALCPDPMI